MLPTKNPAFLGLLSWILLLAPLAAARAQSPQKRTLQQTFLTSNTVAILSLRPKQVISYPAAQLLPIEVAKAAGEKYLGMDPAKIVRVVVVAEPLMGVTPYYAAVLRAETPWDLNAFAPELLTHVRPGEIAGKKALVSEQPALPCLMTTRPTTLVVGSRSMIKKLMDRDREEAKGTLNCKYSNGYEAENAPATAHRIYRPPLSESRGLSQPWTKA